MYRFAAQQTDMEIPVWRESVWILMETVEINEMTRGLNIQKLKKNHE